MKSGFNIWEWTSLLLQNIGLGDIPCSYQAAISMVGLIAALLRWFYLYYQSERPFQRSRILKLLVQFCVLMGSGILLWHSIFYCATCVVHSLIVMDSDYKVPIENFRVELSGFAGDHDYITDTDSNGKAELCIPGNLSMGELSLYQSIYGDTSLSFKMRLWTHNIPDTVWLTSRKVKLILSIIDEATGLQISSPLQIILSSPSNGDEVLSPSNNGYWETLLSNDSIFQLEIRSVDYWPLIQQVSILHPSGELLEIQLTKQK